MSTVLVANVGALHSSVAVLLLSPPKTNPAVVVPDFAACKLPLGVAVSATSVHEVPVNC